MLHGLAKPIGNFQGVMAGLERLDRRIAAANVVIEAARNVNQYRLDVDDATYVGLAEHIAALDESLRTFDREVERIRSRARRNVP